MSNYGIVVPFYNQYNGLKLTLDSLKALPQDVPVKFISMGSVDGSQQLLNDFRQEHRELYVYKTDDQLPMALNAAFDAFEDKVDAICILRPGVIADPEALETLRATVLRQDVDTNKFSVATAAPVLTNERGLARHTGVLMIRAEPVLADAGMPIDHPRVQREYGFQMLRDQCLMFNRSIWQGARFREDSVLEERIETDKEGTERTVTDSYKLTACYVDFDYTLRVHKAGYENLYNPKAQLRSYETPYGHQSQQEDMFAWYMAHGNLQELSGRADAQQYYGTLTPDGRPLGNFPAIEEWKDTKYEGPERPKIYVILADHDGCGTYRLKNPVRQLIFRGYHVIFSTYISPVYGKWADVIICQRQVEERSKNFLSAMQELGKKVIYEIDDFFHGLHDTNPVTAGFQQNPQWLRNMECIIYQSDALIVSTPELKKQYGRFNTKAFVVPNHVDLGAFPIDQIVENHGEGVRIGWAGSSTHDNDMDQMVTAMTKIMNEFPKTVFVFIGADYRHLFPEIPLNRMEWIPSTYGHELPVEEYYTLLTEAQLDIALAPLADNLFNRCKSDVKLLEYGALGIVPVASDVEPYTLMLKKPNAAGVKLGFLARNSGQWYRHIKTLIEEPALRMAMGHAILDFVWTQRSVQQMADRYEEILKIVLAGQGHKPIRIERQLENGQVISTIREPVHSLNVPYLNNLTSKQAYQQQQLRLKYQEMVAKASAEGNAGYQPAPAEPAAA